REIPAHPGLRSRLERGALGLAALGRSARHASADARHVSRRDAPPVHLTFLPSLGHNGDTHPTTLSSRKIKENPSLRVFVAICFKNDRGPVFYAEAGLLQDTSGRYHAAAIDRVDCPSDCPSAGTWAFLGGSEALTQFLEAHPRELIEHGARATRLRLLALEATAHPDRVRPPVDLLHLGPEGPTWVQRQPSCPTFPSP